MNTSCGVLLLSPPGQLLLGHATHARHWDIPKGMGEPGETPRETAVREALEETGLRLDEDSLVDLGSFAYRPAKRLHLFAACLAPMDTAGLVCTSVFQDRFGRLLPELDAFRWVPFGGVQALCAPSMARVLGERVDLTGIYAALAGRRAGGRPSGAGAC